MHLIFSLTLKHFFMADDNRNRDRYRDYNRNRSRYGEINYDRVSDRDWGGAYGGAGQGRSEDYEGHRPGGRRDYGEFGTNYGGVGYGRREAGLDRGIGYSGDYGGRDYDRGFSQEGRELAGREHSGPHQGKGPRNYQRSQDRIREDVCERLTDDDMIDATDIEVQVQNDEVVLNGVVHNREEKRRAEDLAEAVAGVRNVENRLRVQDSPERRKD
jgi:hypothetical protein